MENKLSKATIAMDKREIVVEFEGLWTRRMVEGAYNAMLRNLRAYILQQSAFKSEKSIKKGTKK